MTMRRDLPSDNLAKEFAVLRGDGGENPIDMLNNTVDVVDFHYATAQPSSTTAKRMGSLEDAIVTGKSLAGLSSIRQSEQAGTMKEMVASPEVATENLAGNNTNVTSEQNGNAGTDFEAKHKELLEEIEEQKAVINDLIDQLTSKTIEIVELKK